MILNMEFINIPRWSAKDVADWMKGLDSVLQPYIDTVLSRKVTGDRLLLMTAQDLEELGILKIGHQEIMLDAVNLLCNLHYRQSVEDLQSVTLNLNTRTNCLTKLLASRCHNGGPHAAKNGTSPPQSVPASILVLVAEVVTAAKTVISWLDRPPFVTGDHFFKMFREDILKSALELTQQVQQSGFLPHLEAKLHEISQELGELSDDLVKKASDPLIIQTSTIDFVSIKKKRSEEELGLEIRTSAIDGTHLITQVKPTSASGSTDKVHIGDEILQVNYQTVVGWNHGKVIEALKSNSSDITFTLKKRPKHLSQPGQIQRPKQNPFLHPNTGISSLPNRRPSADKRRRVVVKDDMYLPHREAEKQAEEGEERPPDTPSELPESPLDSPSIDTTFLPPRGFPRGRRPTMVPGMALSRRRGHSRQGRPRSLPANLDELSKELGGSLGKKGSPRGKIQPLPPDMKFPSSKKTSGKRWDTEPMPKTLNLDETMEGVMGDGDSTDSMPPSNRKGAAKITKVSFKDVDSQPEGRVCGEKDARDLTTTEEEEEDKDCCDPGNGEAADKSAGTVGSAGDGSVEDENVVAGGDVAESVHSPQVKSGGRQCQSGVNTNNNEGNQMPVELTYLCDVVDEFQKEQVDDEDFVHLEIPGTDEVDWHRKPVTFRHHPSSVSSISTISTVDSIDISGVIRRPKKSRGKVKVNRGVSCVDLGPGECKGYLHKKTDKAMRSKWTKLYFVLKEFVLYYFKDEKAVKAKGVICLPGFQVKIAPECSRSHAFKVTHEGTKDILLAASDEKNLKHWMEKLQLATILLQDDNKVRQSRIISETVLKRLDAGAFKEGYVSESTDDESRRGSTDAIAETSSSVSESGSGGTTSRAGTINSLPEPAKALAALEGDTPISSLKRRAKYFGPGASPFSSTESSPSGSPTAVRRGHRSSPGLFSHLSRKIGGDRQSCDPATNQPTGGDISYNTEIDNKETGYVEDEGEEDAETNTDELVKEWKKINNVTVKVFDRGSSFRTKKKERPSLRMSKHNLSRKEEKTYEKNMLLRKLKAKQAELDSVDILLTKHITSGALKEWYEQHEDLMKCLDGQQRESSDSDPESGGQEIPLSSSMSSINTTSTTTSAQDTTALCDDTAPVSDGTTSGCDVQTPMSDRAPAIGEKPSDKLLSTTSPSNESSALYAEASTELASQCQTEDVKAAVHIADEGDSAFVRSEDERSLDAAEVGKDGSVRPVSMRSESETSETSL